MSSNFGQIWRLTRELTALERLKINVTPFFSVAIDLILFKLAGMSDDMHNTLDEFEF